MNNQIRVKSPGLLSTIQDLGRNRLMHLGIPESGAVDKKSLRLANILIGNPQHEACLEVTFIGPELEFTYDTTISITGAGAQLKLNSQEIKLNTAINIKKGDLLSVGLMNSGLRSYIAVSGGFGIPNILDSKSTYLKGKFGGLDGRTLKKGDILHGNTPNKASKAIEIPKELLTPYKSHVTLRILPGPEIHNFSQDGIFTFLNEKYTVSEQSDRMGYRLNGKKVELNKSSDILSSGLTFGTIQIPNNGEPIIMLADRQTTGGYSRMANVIQADHCKLAQLRPGDSINFKEISIKEATKLFEKQESLLTNLTSKLK